MALQTEVLAFASGYRLQQLILIGGSMGVVALETVSNCGRVDLSLNLCRIFVGVALETELDRRDFRQLDMRDIANRANFVTAQASRSDRRVNCFSIGLIFVTLEALRRINVLVERNRVGLGKCRRNRGDKGQNEGGQNSRGSLAARPQARTRSACASA